MPDGCAATDERRRNEVIAVKCTLTALAFTKHPPCAAPSRRALRAFGGNPLIRVHREDDRREWDCSGGRPARVWRGGRLIERPTMAPSSSSRKGRRLFVKRAPGRVALSKK